jgi:archaellum component FlaC
MAKKQIEVIDMEGKKTVAKKTSVITTTKRVFAIVSVIWIVFVAWFPLYVKNHYAAPIKKSMVVSLFFDLQRNIVKQYEKLLDGIKDSINLEKPIGVAIEKVKIVEDNVNKVTDTTAKAKEQTAKVKQETAKVSALSGFASKLGFKTGGVDKAVEKANDAVAKADKGIAKVDATAELVNKKLDSVKTELVKVSQIEVDKMIDEAVKKQLDKNSGGLGTTLLTNYGIKHVYPWRPSSWGVATKIYNDLEKSNLGIVQILTNTVNKYFGYVAWGLVIVAWAVGFLIWMFAFAKVKQFLSPFIVCPRCGHTFADKRTAMGLVRAFQPWKWF